MSLLGAFGFLDIDAFDISPSMPEAPGTSFPTPTLVPGRAFRIRPGGGKHTQLCKRSATHDRSLCGFRSFMLDFVDFDF